MADITGEVLRGRYQIERLLGRGGMADVYLAFDMHRQTHVALKLIREDLADDVDFLRRFSREAAALARLDHPNVVRFYAMEQEGALGFIVMDYVPGTTLQRRIAQAGGPLPLTEVTSLLHQIGPALHYAHSLGFIHRDIKPGNIMLREDGTALLSDFGAARVAESATLASLTIGTPAYMSPEQILGKELEAQSDIYSFGLVLFEMLTGRRPFTGDEAGLTGTGTISRLREAHLRLDPPNPSQINPAVPPALADVVLKSLTKDVSDRWPNVVALMDAWDAVLGRAGRRGKAAGAAATAAAPFTTADTLVPSGGAPGASYTASSTAPTTVQPSAWTGQASWPQTQAPASQPISQPVAPATQPKRRSGVWIGAGVLVALILIGVVIWRFVLPGAAPEQTASQTDFGAPTATAEAASRMATATANAAAELALEQKALQISTAEAQSTAAAVRLAETATAAGKVVEEAAAIQATATAQTILNAQATETAVAAATESAAAAAASATAQADQQAQATATAAAGATATADALAKVTPTAPARPAATAQPRATPAPAQPGVVTDFEANATWQTGDQPYGTLQRSTEQAKSGGSSGKLSYNFPAVDGNFVVFRSRPAIALAGQPTGLSAWVYGDGSGHFLNAWLQDSTGQVRQYTFGQVTHQGWQQMTAAFDDTKGWPNVRISGTDSGKLNFPASLWGLVLDGVPDGQASSGAIYIDDIRTVTEAIPAGTPAATGSTTTGAGASASVALTGKLAVPVFAPERGTYDLYVGAASGEGVSRVLDYASQPDLSPNGAQVAYRRWQDSRRGLATMPAGGGAERRLTEFKEDALPTWSPDGRVIVFASRRESDRKPRLYQVSLGGGAATELKRGSDPVFGDYPTFLANGRVVYRSTVPELALVVMNADGSNPQTVIADPSATAPAGSPNGSSVAFMSQRGGTWDVYRIGLDGSGLARLTNSAGNDGLPAWSPDGKSIAFVSDRDGSWGIWVMAADGSDQRKLFALPGSPDGRVSGEPDYSSRGWLEERLSWSG